jgi:hypothetical protein
MLRSSAESAGPLLPLLDDVGELGGRHVGQFLAVELGRPLERDAALVAVGVGAGKLRIAPRGLRRDISLDDLRFRAQLRGQIALTDRLGRSHLAFLLLRGHRSRADQRDQTV